MSTILLRKPPGHFKTLPLSVEATPEQLVYRGLGQPLAFSEMLERRSAISVDDPHRFSLELANLGVSVRLTLSWQGQDYWVLVRQKRNDRGDEVLKMISGYVPAQEVGLPLLTAIQEVAEECLLETPQGWLAGRFGETWLPAPYESSLDYRETPTFALSSLSGAARQLYHGTQALLERPRAYVHLPTASLQLVYDMRLDVPDEARQLSLYHVDECLEEGQLIARLRRDQPDLYLIPLEHGRPCAELLTLTKGKPKRQDTRDIWLSEGFAAQQGWVVQEERIRWEEWLDNVRPLKTGTELRAASCSARGAPYWLRIFSTMDVVELFSTNPSTRTSPP